MARLFSGFCFRGRGPGRVFDFPGLPHKAGRQGGRGFGQAHRQRPQLPVHQGVGGQHPEQPGLVFRGQVMIVWVLINFLPDERVREGAEGFHNVIRQTIGIVTVVVMDAERGQEAASAEGAGHRGPQDGVNVIERGVGGRPFPFAFEIRPEQGFPVAPGALAFQVVGIPAAHARGQPAEGIPRTAPLVQHRSLVAQLGFDGLLPELLFQRLAGRHLGAEPFVLHLVGVEMEKHAGGHVPAVADYHGRVVGRQFAQHRLCEGDLPVVEHHETEVFNGRGGFFTGFLVGDHQLPETGAQVIGVIEKEGAFNHVNIMA